MSLEIILWKNGGPRYMTRGGRIAIVLEANVDLTVGINDVKRQIWRGRVGADWVEWNGDGTHRGGDSALDLVAIL